MHGRTEKLVGVHATGGQAGSFDAFTGEVAQRMALLDRIPKRSPVILTSSTKRPWVKDGLGSSFSKAKRIAWPNGDNLHFHDLRGTAATKFYLAGLSEREIAEIMAWEEEQVAKIIRRYVGRSAAIEGEDQEDV